jgi:hypothetical protein
MKRAAEVDAAQQQEKKKPREIFWGPRFRVRNPMPGPALQALLAKRMSNASSNACLGLTEELWACILSWMRTPDIRTVSRVCCRLYCLARVPRDELRVKHGARHPVHLSDEQYAVYRAAVDLRRNVFLTGRAGCGKTQVLRSIVHALRRLHGLRVLTAAFTGQAACALDGVTLHRLCGWVPGHARRDQGPARPSQKAVATVQGADVIVLDEVSMIKADMFARAGAFVSRAKASADGGGYRGDLPPFCGVQLVGCGDFAQLPPIVRRDSQDEDERSDRLAFETDAWDRTFEARYHFCLQRPFRQDSDRSYLSLLDALRFGAAALTSEHLEMLRSRADVPVAELLAGRFADAPNLYFTNAKVDAENTRRVLRLKAELKARRAPGLHSHVFAERELYANPDATAEQRARAVKQQHSLAASMELCPGALVMCRRNYAREGLYNGKMGRVEALLDLSKPDVQREVFRRARGGRLHALFYPSARADGDDEEEEMAADDSSLSSSASMARILARARRRQMEAAEGDPAVAATEGAWADLDRRVGEREELLGMLVQNLTPGIAEHKDDPEAAEIDDEARFRGFQAACARAKPGVLPEVSFRDLRGTSLASGPGGTTHFLVFPCTTTLSEWVPVGSGRRSRNVKRPLVALAQLPLSIAFACTIHKAQGSTLDAANIDLDDCRSPELVYTALSRVRCLRDLRLLSLPPPASRLRSETAERARAFDKKISQVK